MQPIDLKKIILDQKDRVLNKTRYIDRGVFAQVNAWRANNQIIVITGIRRCGKSTLLQQIRAAHSEKDYYLNFDDDRLTPFELSDFQKLVDVFQELYGEQKTFYFDEIQIISEWERFVRRLFDQGNKVYITGSNAEMLSRELGTRLTGRHLTIRMYPFSFSEYLRFVAPEQPTKNLNSKQENELKLLFDSYCEFGGFPEYIKMKECEYLHTLYENILYKDIMVRYGLTKERSVKKLAFYLASNVAKDISFSGLKAYISVLNASTVSEYCQYFENAYLYFFINRFSYSLKQQEGYIKKSYAIDIALAKNIGFRPGEDSGRFLENLVYLQLIRGMEKEIYFHREKYECDFIVRESGKITQAIQVCMSLEDVKTRKREVQGLLEVMKIYQLTSGIIVTHYESGNELIEEDGVSYQIAIIPVWQWLLESV